MGTFKHPTRSVWHTSICSRCNRMIQRVLLPGTAEAHNLPRLRPLPVRGDQRAEPGGGGSRRSRPSQCGSQATRPRRPSARATGGPGSSRVSFSLTTHKTALGAQQCRRRRSYRWRSSSPLRVTAPSRQRRQCASLRWDPHRWITKGPARAFKGLAHAC